MKLTSTNKPTTCHNHTPSGVSKYSRPLCGSRGAVGSCPFRHLHSVSAAIATGKRPAPFRTRKLSPSAPMVLPGGPGGRVGRRRTFFWWVAVPPTRDRVSGGTATHHHFCHPTPMGGSVSPSTATERDRGAGLSRIRSDG